MEKISIEILNWDKFNSKRKDVTNPTWFKLSHNLPNSESLFGLGATERYVFVALLCLAGKQCSASLEVDLGWFSHWAGSCFTTTEAREAIEKLDGRTVRVTSTLRPRAVLVTQNRIEEIREEKKREENKLPTAASAAPPLLQIWNSKSPPLPKCIKITPKRRSQLQSRWEESPDPGYWEKVVTRIAESPFCTGKNDRGWKAGFDFLLKPDTHVRVMEGAYGGGAASTDRVGAPLTDPLSKYMAKGGNSSV